MSKKNITITIISVLIVICVLSIGMCIYFKKPDNSVRMALSDVKYDSTDYNVDENEAVGIILPAEASGSKLTKDCYEISKKNKLTITKPGTYVISTEAGKTSDGLIEVDYQDESITGMVHLILKDIDMTSANNTSPDSDKGLITIRSNVERAVITIAKDSIVTLKDTGSSGIDADDNTSAAYTGGIVCRKTPLTINGEGILNITSVNGNGIKCTDTLKLVNCSINISGENGKGCGNKGIVAKENIAVKDAKLNILSEDDAIHSNGNIRIDSGNIYIEAADDGIHADSIVEINADKISITKSYEGIEGRDITVNSGIIDIVSSDDSINAAGGNDGSGVMRPKDGRDPWTQRDFRPGAEDGTRPSKPVGDAPSDGRIPPLGDAPPDGRIPPAGDAPSDGRIPSVGQDDDTSYSIVINGGTITADAEGDGIDSNGDLYIKGGMVVINGPTRGGNGAIDYGDRGCVCEITGGTLIAAGSIGMDVAPASDTQQVINIRLSAVQKGGTKVALKDKEGNIVMEACPSKSFQSVVMSSGDLKIGQTYTYTCGGNTI